MKCPVCGNEIEPGSNVCPWCETVLDKAFSTKKEYSKYRTYNIKNDQPTTETALNRLKKYIYGAKSNHVKVLKIIHGYGSSGVGGDIRYTIREYLQKYKYSTMFKYYVPGEEFSISYSSGIKLVNQFPHLRSDSDWNGNNKGITFIVI